MGTPRATINNMPLRGGLATAGKRATINEAQLWGAQNMYPDLDGLLRTRPGVMQHGQTLTEPSSSATRSYHELFDSLAYWDFNDASSDYSTVLASGMLTVTQKTGDVYFGRAASSTSTSGDYSLKFALRLTNPADGGVNNSGGSLRTRVSGDGGTSFHEIVFKAGGVYVLSGAVDTLAFEPDYALDLGGFHSYELYYNSTADTLTIWFDGEEQSAYSMAAADDAVASVQSSTQTVEFHMDSGTGSWGINLTDLQYSDLVYSSSVPPFESQRVVDGIQYTRQLTGGGTLTSLVVATETILYADIRQRGAWRPIMRINRGHTYMVPFQEFLLIFDDDGQTSSRVFKWDGVDVPVQISDAPPVRFGSEYRTRMWAAGDRAYPLRVYYTASRQEDVWFAPEYDPDETFDEVVNAGFVVIPSETGDSVTGVYGEYLGVMIVETVKGLWQVTGSSPASFQIENISRKVGGSAPRGMVQVGNQLFVVGTSGVVSVSTAQTYGDLQTAMPSGAIADKWSSLPEIDGRVDRNQLGESYFTSIPSLNVALLGMRGQGSTVLDKVFAFSAMNQQWHGPWTLNPTFMTQIEYGVPTVEILMHGDESGRVTLTNLSVHTDLGSTYASTIKSPMLCGRSVDPSLTPKAKRWRTLRLYLMPRVNQTFNLRWKTDQEGWQPSSSGENWSQNVAKQESLSNDFRLNIDKLHSQEDVETLEILLDAKGRYFQWELSSDYNIVLQGYQVEFLAGDEEES